MEDYKSKYILAQRKEFCPKCGSRLSVDKDCYGLFLECIFCGYIHDLESESKLEAVGKI